MTAVVITLGFALVAPVAQGHPLPPKPRKTLKQRIEFLEGAVAHNRYVCHHGRGVVRAWHCKALSWSRRELGESYRDRARLALRRALSTPTGAIRHVFGRWADEALRVSYCETGGTYSVWAENGQYLGLFQMGAGERARFGHGSTPLAQARAAYRYFAASGFDWSPWACKP